MTSFNLNRAPRFYVTDFKNENSSLLMFPGEDWMITSHSPIYLKNLPKISGLSNVSDVNFSIIIVSITAFGKKMINMKT